MSKSNLKLLLSASMAINSLSSTYSKMAMEKVYCNSGNPYYEPKRGKKKRVKK